jgi:hypothetical protein
MANDTARSNNMQRDLLPFSIFALALAVGLHAIAPAQAEDVGATDPSPEQATEAPAEMAPDCRMIRLGTAKEFNKVMGGLYEDGAKQFMVVGSGLVCGWN